VNRRNLKFTTGEKEPKGAHKKNRKKKNK